MNQQSPQPYNSATERLLQTAMTSPSTLEVAILLCTYNGRAFLKEQIDSFIAQTHKKWTLYVSDDGSKDGTLELLQNYPELIATKRLQIFSGPRAGFSQNFMSLVRNQKINADFFAFSDQDDVWFSDKLERSLQQLAAFPQDVPALYCSRTRLVDENCKVIGHSPNFKKQPAFQNALIQSLAGANTMLFNGATRELLTRIPSHTTVVAHDWLTYLLTTAWCGNVVYDSQPTLDYRQHGNNVIGANSSLRERMIRVSKVINGRFRYWSDINMEILECFGESLPLATRQTLNDFRQGRQCSIIKRFALMRKSGIYRQTLAGNISLILAIFLNKI